MQQTTHNPWEDFSPYKEKTTPPGPLLALRNNLYIAGFQKNNPKIRS